MKKIICIMLLILLYLSILQVSGNDSFFSENSVVEIDNQIRANNNLSNKFIIRIYYENDNLSTLQ